MKSLTKLDISSNNILVLTDQLEGLMLLHDLDVRSNPCVDGESSLELFGPRTRRLIEKVLQFPHLKIYMYNFMDD